MDLRLNRSRLPGKERLLAEADEKQVDPATEWEQDSIPQGEGNACLSHNMYSEEGQTPNHNKVVQTMTATKVIVVKSVSDTQEICD